MIWDDNCVDGDVTVIQGCSIVRLENVRFESPCEKIMIQNDGRVFGLDYQFEKIIVICGKLTGCKNNFSFKMHNNFSLPLNSLSPISCFNVIDPTTLYSSIK